MSVSEMNEMVINAIERAKWNKMHMYELCHSQGVAGVVVCRSSRGQGRMEGSNNRMKCKAYLVGVGKHRWSE